MKWVEGAIQVAVTVAILGAGKIYATGRGEEFAAGYDFAVVVVFAAAMVAAVVGIPFKRRER